MPHPVLDAPISPLRQRLIDDMTMRRFSQETQRNYSRERRHTAPHRPGAARHDPTWPGLTTPRSSCVSGDNAARAAANRNRIEADAKPLLPPREALDTPPKGHLPERQRACCDPTGQSRQRAKTEIPIAIACDPRVRSSGTFVRLPAPETLHDSGRAASDAFLAKAAVPPPAPFAAASLRDSFKASIGYQTAPKPPWPSLGYAFNISI